MSQDAYSAYGKDAPPETLVIVDSDLVKIDSSKSPKPLSVPVSRMAREMGRPVVATIIMLGFLAATSEVVSYEALKKAVLNSIPAGTEKLNMEAFELGYNYGVEHSGKD